ncbi:MAG: hypothetical protein R3F60_28860 [bacterium]
MGRPGRRWGGVAMAVLMALAACDVQPATRPMADGGRGVADRGQPPDARAPEALDAGSSEVDAARPGPPDAGPPDAGPLDAGPPDAGPLDAEPLDATTLDAGWAAHQSLGPQVLDVPFELDVPPEATSALVQARVGRAGCTPSSRSTDPRGGTRALPGDGPWRTSLNPEVAVALWPGADDLPSRRAGTPSASSAPAPRPAPSRWRPS